MDWIGRVAQHHELYIRYVKQMGVQEQAEDIVQEMYLRINQYSNAEKCLKLNQVNKHYIWRILYNLCQSYRRDSKRFETVSLDGVDLYQSINFHAADPDKLRFKDVLTYDQPDNEREEAYSRITDKVLLELDKLDKDDKFNYNQVLFNLSAGYDNLETDPKAYSKPLSMRKIEKITDISLTSIFNTLKQCKEHLSEELREDIEDFYNQEYELI